MNELYKRLKPVERLYLVSLKKKEVYNQKSILYCLISQLIDEGKIFFDSKTNKYGLKKIEGEELLKPYEIDFHTFIKYKRWEDLDHLISNIMFDSTLAREDIIEIKKKKKSFLGFSKNVNSGVKTDKFYEIYNEIEEGLENSKNNITHFLCNKPKEDDNIRKLVEKFWAMILKRREE
jgi:hypothetical protein